MSYIDIVLGDNGIHKSLYRSARKGRGKSGKVQLDSEENMVCDNSVTEDLAKFFNNLALVANSIQFPLISSR